jgi:hypothetical protein
MTWQVLDPYASDLFQLVGDTNTASAASERPSARRSLQKAYDEWRKQFTVASAESEWRRGLDELAARQVERYLAALTLLDVSPAGPRSWARAQSAMAPLNDLRSNPCRVRSSTRRRR